MMERYDKVQTVEKLVSILKDDLVFIGIYLMILTIIFGAAIIFLLIR